MFLITSSKYGSSENLNANEVGLKNGEKWKSSLIMFHQKM